MWYVYVLRSMKTGMWYTGSTNDLRKRFSAHNRLENRSTRHGAPWTLIYYEASRSREDARLREKYLKSGMGKRYIKNRLKTFFAQGV